jgi:hypothetical protein
MENRDYVTTTRAAELLCVQGQTMRRGLCVNHHYLGMVPIKLPNRRLLWPRKDIEELLSKNLMGGES